MNLDEGSGAVEFAGEHDVELLDVCAADEEVARGSGFPLCGGEDGEGLVALVEGVLD